MLVGSKNIFVQKKCWVQKKFGVVKKNLGLNKFKVQENFRFKNMLDPKQFWVQKFGPKKFGVQNILGPKKGGVGSIGPKTSKFIILELDMLS